MRMSLCALAFALALPACAGGSDALRTELASLRQEVGRMRAENNILTARIETLELSRERRAPEPAPTARAVGGADPDRPSLDVVHLAPTNESAPVGGAGDLAAGEPAEAVDGGEARPVLRSTSRGEVVAQSVSPRPVKQAPAPRAALPGKGTVR
jgi:hypothetical protein